MKKLLLVLSVMVLGVLLMGATNRYNFNDNTIESLRMGIQSDNQGLSESSIKLVEKYDIQELKKEAERIKLERMEWRKELNEALKELENINFDELENIHIQVPGGVDNIKIDLSELKVQMEQLKEYLNSDEFKNMIKEASEIKVKINGKK